MSTEPELGRFVPLKMVVSLFLDEHDKSEGDEDKAWLIGLRALVALNYDVTAEPKTVRLPLSGNFTVAFPADCLNWVKIGIMDSRGTVSTLKINNALTTFRDTNPNRLTYLAQQQVNDSVQSLAFSPFFLNYYNNGYYNNYFGIGGGLVQYGECRIDPANNVIIFPPDFQYDSILLEYISAPEKDEDYKVPLAFQEAIIAFIAWKFKLAPRQEFYGEVIRARRTLPGKKITLQEINQFIREASGGYLHA